MKVHPIFAAKLVAVSIAAAALASCGGGGGGGSSGPVPTVALTASNAQNVGGDALIAGVQTPSRSNLFVPASAQPQALRQTLVLSRFLQEQLARVRPAQSAPQMGAVMTPADVQTVLCQSGNITVVSGTSSVTETFNACSNAPGLVINGVVTIANFASTQSSFSASVSTNLTFSATGFLDQNFTGNFSISESGIGGPTTTFTLSGSNLSLHEGANTEDLGSFTLSTTVDTSTSGTTASVSFGYTSTEIGGTVVVTTLTPFQITSGKTFPHAGVLQISGINGSSIKVTVNGDESAPAPQVTIQLDADGDGVFEVTLNKNWSDLTA